jgi:transcriptional regulator with XRE-family HTH domain
MAEQKELTADSIKELRKLKNWSQEQLAKILGVSTSTVIRWEHGDAKPTGTAAAVLVALLAGLTGPMALGAFMTLGPLAVSAYGIYRLLKDVFEPGGNDPAGPSSPVS